MDTFRQSKKIATVSLMLGLFLGGSSAFAGDVSPLDPFVTPRATTGKRGERQMLPEATNLSTTYVNVDDKEPAMPKLPHAKKNKLGFGHSSSDKIATTKVEKVKVPKVDAPKTKVKDSSIAKAPKSDDGIVGGTKAASAKIGDEFSSGTKKVGDGLTSGAKASGSFFMKGAKAIGNLKGSDDKGKVSAKAPKNEPDVKVTEGKRLDGPKPKKVARKNDSDDDARSKAKQAEKAAKEEKAMKISAIDDDKQKGNSVLAPISKTFKDGLQKLPFGKPSADKESKNGKVADKSAAKSADKISEKAAEKAAKSNRKNKNDEPTYIANGKPVKKTKEKAAGGSGIMSKTLGILPFVGGSKKASEPARQVAKASNDELITSDSKAIKTTRQRAEDEVLGPSL